MTDNPNTPDGPEPAHSAFRVLTAIADLGEATAAAIAQHAELGYSTVTPKLRAWETSGHAEKYRHAATSQTLWRLTATGRATTGVTDDDTALHAADGPVAPAAPSDSPPAELDMAPPYIEADQHKNVEGSEAEVAEVEDAGDVGSEVGGPAADVAAAEPPPSDADADPLSADAADTADDADASAVDADTAAAPKPVAVAKRKRPAGALEASVLEILRNRPDETFKVNDLRKLVDKADEGTGYPAASAGAISNALIKLTGTGDVDAVEAKHATYQAAPAGD
jgi:hypothetical protein